MNTNFNDFEDLVFTLVNSNMIENFEKTLYFRTKKSLCIKLYDEWNLIPGGVWKKTF